MKVNKQNPSKPSSSTNRRISLEKRTYHDDDTDFVQINGKIALNDAIDRIDVMKRLEESTYAKQGFFHIWEDHQEHRSNHQSVQTIIIAGDKCYLSEVTRPSDNDALNEFYRSFMCKWSYQLIDHLQVDREVVAVAFSYVDRLLERYYYCTKKVFRLAVVTSIYLAINLLSSTEVPLEQVTTFCRNEYTTKMIGQMKMIILDTFNYNLHPPTIKGFVEHLCAFLPREVSMSTKQHIIQQSYFLAELSTYDYYFVNQKSSFVAYAAIVDTVENLNLDKFNEVSRCTFIHQMSKLLDIYSRSISIATVQQRLDDLYKQSKQYAVDTSQDTSSSKNENCHSTGMSVNIKERYIRRCSSEVEINNIMHNNTSIRLRH